MKSPMYLTFQYSAALGSILLLLFGFLYLIHWPHLCKFFHLPIYWHSNSLYKWTAISKNAITTICLVAEMSDHHSCDPRILLPAPLGTEDIKAGLLKAFLTDLMFHMKFCTDYFWIRNLDLQWRTYFKHSVSCSLFRASTWCSCLNKNTPIKNTLRDFHNQTSCLVNAQQHSFNYVLFWFLLGILLPRI